jgi:hypothetical protein
MIDDCNSGTEVLLIGEGTSVRGRLSVTVSMVGRIVAERQTDAIVELLGATGQIRFLCCRPKRKAERR